MKKTLFIWSLLVLFSCGTKKPTSENSETNETENIEITKKSIPYYSKTISKEDLKKHLVELTSDVFQGRRTGEKGQKLAANYIKKHYENIGVGTATEKGYFQTIPKDYFNGESAYASENVLGYIKGTGNPDEVIVISAHYDHLGLIGTELFYGADDNGSGTSAVMEIAEAFALASKDNNGPKRSILFLNLTGEEEGLYGSRYYSENPIFSFDKTIADLNIDMVGRIDKEHADNENYVYLIGADRLSKELHDISEKINTKYTQLELDYTFNAEDDTNRYYYRSDHFNFAKNGVPVIFYFNGVHADYHKSTDTEDKINYDILAKRTKLVFATAWELANREESLKRDKK